MQTFTAIIVEDEPHAQAQLKQLLEKHTDILIAGQAYNLADAGNLVEKVKPDLVFSDVDLPPGNAFDWLATYPKLPFSVIFTTSYDTYAIQAFRLAAVDYLLKPLLQGDLDKALERFRSQEQRNVGFNQVRQLLENLNQSQQKQKIALPTFSGYVFVPIDEIIRCESDNTYTTFYTLHQKPMIVSRTLKECEQLLASQRFFRIHNSHLINLAYVREYIKGEGGQVKMEDGSYVDVSRRRKDEFLRLIR